MNAKSKSKRTSGVDPQLIKALGHPLRIHALALLNERVASPNEIAKELGEGLSHVSYHVKVLSDCGFAELVKTEPRRGAVEHFYRGTKRAFLPDSALRQLSPAVQSSAMANAVTEIFDDVAASMEHGIFNEREERHVSWTPLALDEEGWQELATLLAKTLDGVFDIQAQSNERRATTSEESISATVAMLGFESSRRSHQRHGD